MMRLRSLPLLTLLVACGPPSSQPVEEVLKDLDAYYGREITIRARFKAGVRCRINSGVWQTYCGDCQYCEGPLVVDVPEAALPADANAQPMVLRGRWKKQDIACAGPLNHVRCYPIKVGAPYVVRGVLERRDPPRLVVSFLWPIKDSSLLVLAVFPWKAGAGSSS